MRALLEKLLYSALLLTLLLGTTTSPAVAAPAAPTLAQCNGIKDLAFVAHLDDDLLFMNPDIGDNINAGGCVHVVYLTASERGEGEGYMLGRERGVRAAYAYMAQQPDLWSEDTVQIGAYHLARFVLQGNPRIQLWHMRLKDPWLGKGWGSLTPLSEVESVADKEAGTLGPYPERYTRTALVATIARIIENYHPTTVRHLDDTISVPYAKLCWRCAGHGHPDHIASARLVRDALALAPGNYAETGYIDYPSQERASNLAQAEIARKTEIFRRYAWNDYRYCAGPEGCQEPAGPAAAWVQRAYYVSRHNVAPDLFVNTKGDLMLFASGEDNDAVNMWDNGQRRWNTLGGRTAGPLSAFTYADGTAGLFARDTLGGLWVNSQQAAGGWKGWQAIAGARFARVPAVTPQGPAAAVAMGYDGRYYWTIPSGMDNAWAAWKPLPDLPNALGNATIAMQAAGTLIVFASDSKGQLFATRQRDETGEHWQPWARIAAPATDSGMAAIRNAGGLIELYLRRRDNGHLLRITQTDAGDTASLHWSDAADLGIVYVGEPAIGRDEAGQVAVAVLERSDGPLWLLENAQATRIADHIASLPALRFRKDTLYVVARGAGKLQAYHVLARTNGIWNTASVAGVPDDGGGPFAGLTGLASQQKIDTLVAAQAPEPSGKQQP